MALFIPGPIISSIHGSIGGANFYKHGPWNVIRRKGFAKSSTKFLRGKAQSCWSRALSDAKARYTGPVKTKVDNSAALSNLSRHGISYNLTGFQLLVSMNFLSLYYFGWTAIVAANLANIIPFTPMTITLEDAPAYIKIVYENPLIVSPFLVFDWGHPNSYLPAPKPKKFQYHAISALGAGGTWNIAPGNYPRLTGTASLWWRARVINIVGQFSRQVYGRAEKTNWQ